ncbi:hypothetical protein FSP39_005350 [Pinctada imbricata]|uniref:Uncharacterized protein n=1 Tax=Pinctada imbricata TaxID=66713 RepID=A0AA88Y7R2_PINIB|nr:hypothetical protein FSP39_005350 [Pinctada imbricata]
MIAELENRLMDPVELSELRNLIIDEKRFTDLEAVRMTIGAFNRDLGMHIGFDLVGWGGDWGHDLHRKGEVPLGLKPPPNPHQDKS